MIHPKNFLQSILLFALILNVKTMNAQMKTDTLDALEKSIVAISALTATGDLEKLKVQLNAGLDARLTVNEIKEALVQLYAYCGFPRSLNAISAFMQVMEDRKAKGISDATGKEATSLKHSTDKYERGRKTLETLTKTPQAKPAPGFGEFAPRIDAFLKEHLFADIFDNDVLTYEQRELVTISALAAMPGAEPQLQSHISMGINTGISTGQVKSAFDIIEQVIGKERADNARALLSKMNK